MRKNFFSLINQSKIFLFRSTGTIVGSIAGGFVGLIVLCVITYVLGNKFCKKKPPPGTKIHPTRVSTVTSSSGSPLFLNIDRKSALADQTQSNLKLSLKLLIKNFKNVSNKCVLGDMILRN